MRISSSPWFVSIAQEWTSLDFEGLWAEFLADPDVKYVAASATDEDYRRMFLQFLVKRPEIVDNILAKNTWLAADITAAYQQKLSRAPTDEEIANTVQAFLTSPQLFALARSSPITDYRSLFARFLVATMESDPTSWYSSAIQSFFGDTTLEQRRQLIFGFLLWPKLLATVEPSADDYQRLFMEYLSTQQATVYRAEEATGVSPEAFEQSKVLWAVFDLLAEAITTTSIAQIRSNELIRVMTKRREAYADMAKEVPQYIGTGTTTKSMWSWLYDKSIAPQTSAEESSLPSSADFAFTKTNFDSDPAKFTFGYGDISLTNISEWIYSQYAEKGGGTFTLYSGDAYLGDYTYSRNRLEIIVTNGGGSTPTVSASLYTDTTTGGWMSAKLISSKNPFDSPTDPNRAVENTTQIEYSTVDWGETPHTTIAQIQNSKTLTAGASQESIISSINGQVYAVWNEGRNRNILSDENSIDYESMIMSGNYQGAYAYAVKNPKIQWQSGILASEIYGSTDKKATATLNIRNVALRGTYNQRLSSYTSGIDTRMDTLKNLTDQQSQLINAAMSGQKMTNNLIQSLVQMLQQILGSMFA
jgi:hypothetical protein